MVLKKFELTRLSELKEGDRFYFPSNKNKVFQLMQKHRISLRHHYTFTCMHLGKSKDIKEDKEVVYLRSTK